MCPTADGQHRPLSCEASLWQVSRPGVAAQLGRHGEELPYSPSKSKSNYTQILFIPLIYPGEVVERKRMRHNRTEISGVQIMKYSMVYNIWWKERNRHYFVSSIRCIEIWAKASKNVERMCAVKAGVGNNIFLASLGKNYLHNILAYYNWSGLRGN